MRFTVLLWEDRLFVFWEDTQVEDALTHVQRHTLCVRCEDACTGPLPSGRSVLTKGSSLTYKCTGLAWACAQLQASYDAPCVSSADEIANSAWVERA